MPATIDETPIIDLLPPPAQLERRCKALATLDAILSPEWDTRYYSFNRAWDAERGDRMGSMRNGCGDEWFILFGADEHAAIKGFWHESPARDGASIPGVLEGCPPEYTETFLGEPAFSRDHTTFAFWWTNGRWETSAAVTATDRASDGAEYLELVVGGAEDYVAFAQDYFEVELDAGVVERFFRHEPLTLALAQGVREDVDLEEIAEAIEEIGYPVVGA